MENVSWFKKIFSDKIILISGALFLLWYTLVIFKILNLQNGLINLTFTLIVFTIPCLIASAILFYTYNKSNKILHSALIGAVSFLVLTIINIIIQAWLYSLLYVNRGEFDGIQFLYINVCDSFVVYILSVIVLISIYFVNKNTN